MLPLEDMIKLVEKVSKESHKNLSNKKHIFDKDRIGSPCQVCGCSPFEALTEPCIDYTSR